MNRSGKNDELSGPEAHTLRRQVVERQCDFCRHRVDTGYWAFGEPVLDCDRNLRPPRGRVCRGFEVDPAEVATT